MQCICVTLLFLSVNPSGSVVDVPLARAGPHPATSEKSSIAECEAAWISHVGPVKILNGRICSILIRFLPAESAIIFLSPGFSLWPCSAPVFTCTKWGIFSEGGKWKTSLTRMPAITL